MKIKTKIFIVNKLIPVVMGISGIIMVGLNTNMWVAGGVFLMIWGNILEDES